MKEVKISKKLQDLIDKANSTFGKGMDIVLDAYNQAIADGHKPRQAAKILLTNIVAFQKSTIYSYLPDEAKIITKPKKIPKLESPIVEDHIVREIAKNETSTIIEVESTPDDARTPNPVTQASQTAEAVQPAPATSGQDAEIASLKSQLSTYKNVVDDMEHSPRVKELKDERDSYKERADRLEEAFKKSGAGFQTAAKVAESRRKVLMSKKFFGSIFAVNSNNGRVKDFDFELVLESDRIVEVSSRAVNVVKMPMEALSK